MFKHMLPNSAAQRQKNASSKNLILSILNSTATKREAKEYLARYADDAGTTHHCLILIRSLHTFPADTLSHLADTLRRLRILGLRPVFILPPTDDRAIMNEQFDLLDSLLNNAHLQPIILRDGLTKTFNGTSASVLSTNSELFNNDGNKAYIPVIGPYIYDEKASTEYMATSLVDFMHDLCKNVELNIIKFYILNNNGGIPSTERNNRSHVFINLSQEFDFLSKNLRQQIENVEHVSNLIRSEGKRESNSQFDYLYLEDLRLKLHEHSEDLKLMDVVLSGLDTSTTGLITTVKAASLPSDKNNPLLYNLLTDRSLVSSSLPLFKRITNGEGYLKQEGPKEDGTESSHTIDPSDQENKDNATLVTTVLKKGIDINIFAESKLTTHNSIGLPALFQNKSDTGKYLDEKDKLNLLKMTDILEKGFLRKLNLEHYLNRINGKIASIIIIGDYEGIAILTYEGPSNDQFVYLDKFAVLPHLKGSLGISDIIFNLIFKRFPDEVIWRSRKDNVVNKWYFQRSVAVIDLSIDLSDNANSYNKSQVDSQFNLFYYGNRSDSLERLRKFAKYVRDIKPSWL
ncbi:hypothetical protein KAFR_0A01640 [Kazachstania africana CBS 2517]|uniref:Amino-acid acetyltransferase, mitochondrial n=1 Tax=Kazachstania africana (strain ATCC 22294 / BCRC 22015 / CBS 2517 / CECT 1963 / NBRC 1671 / NRRL Y-8276) TaxID=1071382 RepID=H2AMK2_KAZAF|nr:hypothetical protein KAFR_0A01640 [Kazachstania africana CBS 2517]CCF55602.1 hypothetical protein KAFR_0A01640 [Kazachstania africana CBS 2517]